MHRHRELVPVQQPVLVLVRQVPDLPQHRHGQLGAHHHVPHLVPGQQTVLRPQLVEQSVVLPLLLRLHQEVDAGGGGALGCGRHLGPRGGLVSEVGSVALVQDAVHRDLAVGLAEGHQLARHEHPGPVQEAIAVWVRQVPDLAERLVRQAGESEEGRDLARVDLACIPHIQLLPVYLKLRQILPSNLARNTRCQVNF